MPRTVMTRGSLVARHWPFVAVAIGFLAAHAALTAAMIGATGGHLVYPLDDTYIQMAIAKNLAAHAVWGVTRFEFAGAGSSPLWPLLLAGLDRVTGLGARLPLAANVGAGLLVIAAGYAVLRRHISSQAGQAAALGLVVIAAPLPALALIGMEHTLQCAAALATTAAGAAWCGAPRAGGRRLGIAVALLGATLVASRYEGATVVLALVVVIGVMRGWRPA